jgi:Carboxypeptidase regulatory-like domain
VTTRRRAATLLVSLALCLPSGEIFLSAQPAGDTAVRRPSADLDPPTTATIVGYLWNADSAPIPSATLRLRDLGSGRIASTATSNESGEFTFAEADGSTYVVEYADPGGRVLAVGSPFSVVPGETVVTFIRLAPRRPGGGFFTNAAAVVVASAASIGVTAVAPTGRPVSPNR